MNPLTRLFRRSRAFRLLFYASMAPLWALIALISINSLGGYTEVGDLTLLTLVMLFAAWAWWYGEDRDRRQAGRAAPAPEQVDGNGHPPTTA